ncbi:unnamed protein product [Ceutorhynchus assimilis]|uniref:RRM domain-containing protein n=1 Tax=Ceutorhynchus assimilis TaxID=467358 RepID=A0A9N9MPG5_9CUCU|nr:unnamed protein product [Ceutorhynchus assimilis]
MSSRVYVGGIPYETRERDLENFFRGFGRIRDVLIKNGRYGFVEFDDYRDAEDAVYELHGKKLLGMRVSVEMARGRPRGRDQEWFSSRDHRPRQGPPVRTNYRVFVENLSSGVSWQDLKDYLRPAGEVTFADAHKKYKNEGIVEFANYDDMKNAIRKFDDTVLNGRRAVLGAGAQALTAGRRNDPGLDLALERRRRKLPLAPGLVIVLCHVTLQSLVTALNIAAVLYPKGSQSRGAGPGVAALHLTKDSRTNLFLVPAPDPVLSANPGPPSASPDRRNAIPDRRNENPDLVPSPGRVPRASTTKRDPGAVADPALKVTTVSQESSLYHFRNSYCALFFLQRACGF